MEDFSGFWNKDRRKQGQREQEKIYSGDRSQTVKKFIFNV